MPTERAKTVVKLAVVVEPAEEAAEEMPEPTEEPQPAVEARPAYAPKPAEEPMPAE